MSREWFEVSVVVERAKQGSGGDDMIDRLIYDRHIIQSTPSQELAKAVYESVKEKLDIVSYAQAHPRS